MLEHGLKHDAAARKMQTSTFISHELTPLSIDRLYFTNEFANSQCEENVFELYGFKAHSAETVLAPKMPTVTRIGHL